jgi:translation initiation factor IF-2
LKIRIFALAKELDIDSKVLIDFCAKAGVQVKNVLAGISPEERDLVVAYIRSQSAPAPAAPTETAPPANRTATELPTKVRTIRNMNSMVARPMGGRVTAVPAEPAAAEVETPPEPINTSAPTEVSAAAVEEAVEPVAAPAVEAAPSMSSPASTAASSTVAVAASASTAAPQVSARADSPAAPPVAAEQVAAADETDATGEAEDDPGVEPPVVPDRVGAGQPTPIRRSDYVPATGVSRAQRTMQPMQSRGTSETQGSQQLAKKPPKQRPSSLGMIAAVPNFKGPLPSASKPEEPKAQEPELRLTPAQLKSNNPLAEILRKSAEKKKERKVEDDVADVRRDVVARRGVPGTTGGGLGLEESRAQRRDRRRPVPLTVEEERENRIIAKRRRANSRPVVGQLKTTAEIELPISIRTLSEAIGRPAKSLIQILFERGEMVTMNTSLSEEEAIDLAMELGVDLQIRKEKDLEEEIQEIFEEADPPEMLSARPPIVTVLGHVDHGKTTLVDKIRSANVAAGEFGGITQHIAAYQVEHQGQRLTFVDTPGHAAFGEMRARGANVTDLVVLVVAANDGVMPQTVECIAHARAAGVPVVVALNKIDLPDVNEQRALQDLAANNLLAAEWGGDVEVVRTSGMTGKGVPELLDTLLLTAELQEFKANSERPACGVCLEAFRDEGRGPIAWLIVQKGTLKVGDVVLCGESFGKIRAMYNDRDQEVAEASPSTPVKVAGLDLVPKAGDKFLAVGDLDLAREIAESRRQRDRAAVLASRTSKRTLEDILNRPRDGSIQDLAVILKADTPGSLEALRHELRKFEHPEVRVKLLHEGIGGVNESDVYLAAASDAVIVAFHVIAEDRAEQLAQQEGVDIRRYNIIYEVVDEIRLTLEGMLKPEQKEVVTGRAIVLRTFSIAKSGTIAGCRVLNGTIERSHRIHLVREQKILNAYGIASLRREKDDVKEVREGMECGIRLEGFNDVKEGDLLEAYRIDEIKRTLD